MHNFEINPVQIDKIKKITLEEKNFRVKNLEFFKTNGFPNKRLEDWKFSDFRDIVDKNFKELYAEKVSSNIDTQKIDLTRQAVLRGTEWIIKTTKIGSLFKPTPIGLYFSKLWYFEALYPIIFTVGALNRLDAMLATEKPID